MEQLSFDDLEVWKPVPGYEGYYEASSQGRIRSLGRRSRGGTIWGEPFILKPRTRRGEKYYTVDLYRDGVRSPRKLHHVIAETFLGPRPPGMEICHRNDDGDDNCAANLYHGTRAQNAQDRVRNGLHDQAAKTRCKNGHDFTPENTYLRPTGGRACRACARDRYHQYKNRAA